jgi:hypothetical protein
LVCYPVTQIVPLHEVQLVDQFGVEDVVLFGQFELCGIAVKNSQTPPIAPFFWQQYGLDSAINPPAVKLADQFGSETVDIGVSEALLVPALVGGQGEPLVRHWKSYPAAGLIDPSPVMVTGGLAPAPEILDPAPAVTLLVPTLKIVEDVVFGDLNDNHYRCYPVNGQFDPSPVSALDQFGTSVLDPGPANLLCIPTVKELIPVVGGEILGIDVTTMLVAGAFANASWIIPIAGVTAAGIVGFILRRRISKYC